MAVIFFGALMVIDFLTNDAFTVLNFWYLFIFILSSVVYVALAYQRVNLASRLLMLGMFLILIDPTATYWSPGTVLLGIMFTFLFQLLLNNMYERVTAMFINLGIYTYLALSATQPVPLESGDYFASPLTAILTVYMGHFIIIAVVRMIRQQQKLRDQQTLLLEQQRVDILRQFLGHSSHDLRTLLTRISNSIYLAKLKLPPAEQKALSRLEDASQDLEKLVLSMLEMAQLRDETQLELDSVPVDSLIKSVIENERSRADKKSQTIQFNSRTTFAYVCADTHYMHRALGNILQNAILYSPENSQIRISTRTKQSSVVIEISDEGIGIDEEHLPFIFDSFYRADKARNQSTGLNGLGLSIAKKIIELHHGSIAVESEVNVGSEFTIILPMK